MFCDQCGTKNRAEAKFCPQCGERLGASPLVAGQSESPQAEPISYPPQNASQTTPKPAKPFAEPPSAEPTWRSLDAFELLRVTWWFPIVAFAIALVVFSYEGGQSASFAVWLLTSFNMTFGLGLIVAGILALVVYLSADPESKDKVSVFVAGILWWSLVGLIGLVLVFVVTLAVVL